jgi:hypothetical protein
MTLNIPKDLYIGNMYTTQEQEKVRQVKEITAGAQLTPVDLSTKDAYTQTKELNKQTKVSPPTLTKNTLRPAVTDTEIALIHATYYTTPIDIIAHTLSLSVEQVRDIHSQTQHHLLPSIPMVMVTDTSRFITEDRLNTLYESQNEPTINTSKELLRLSKTEQGILNRIKSSIKKSLKKIDKEAPIPPNYNLIKVYEDVSNTNTGLYESKGNIITVDHLRDISLTSTLPFINYHSLPYKAAVSNGFNRSYIKHPAYYQKYSYTTKRLPVAVSNLMYSEILSNYFNENTPSIIDKTYYLLSLPLSFSTNLNVMLNRFIELPDYSIAYTNHKTQLTSVLEYTSSLTNKDKYTSEFNKETNTYTTKVYHKIGLPYLYERAFNAPLFTGDNLNYQIDIKLPTTNTFVPTLESTVNSKDAIKYAFICLKCNAMLSDDTTQECPHIKLKVIKFRTSLQHRKPNRHLKFPMVKPFTISSNPTQEFLNDLNKYKAVKTTTKYDYLFKDTFKYFYTLYLDTTLESHFTVHTYTTKDIETVTLMEYITSVSKDITPLFTNFNLPSKPLYEP